MKKKVFLYGWLIPVLIGIIPAVLSLILNEGYWMIGVIVTLPLALYIQQKSIYKLTKK